MEQKIFDFYNELRRNKIYSWIVTILFPVAIVAMSFVNVNKGIDISDTTYSLSNAKYITALDGSWLYPTFYSNLLLHALMLLPGGNTFLGISIYCYCIKCILGLATYYFFTKCLNFEKELSFIAVIISLGLCWCPETILYNYLTYLLFFAGTAFILAGLKKDKERYLFFAGLCLGCNVFVRFPNLVETALIVVVWAEAALNKRKASLWIRRTLLCIGGFFAAFIPAVLLMVFNGGIGAYVQGIVDLFTMTGDNSAYSGAGMILTILRAYAFVWPGLEHVILMELLVLLGCLVLPTKLNVFRYVCSFAITMGLLVLFLKDGWTSFAYTTYGPISNFGKIIICLTIITFLWTLFAKNETVFNRLLAITGLIITAISPLGTNNELYANLNNMFFVMPVFLYFLTRMVTSNEYLRGVRFSVLLLTLAFGFQAFMFGINFTFRDGETAPMDCMVSNNDVLARMYTTSANAYMYSTIGDLLRDNGLSDRKVVLFGEVPGFAYIFDTPVAISSAWSSLDSYLTSTFLDQMVKLDEKIDSNEEKAPLVVIEYRERDNVANGEGAKQEILKNFLVKYDYVEIYNNSKLSIYSAK